MIETPPRKPPKPLAVWQVGVAFAAAVVAELLLAGAMALASGVWSALSGGGDPLSLLFSPGAMALQILLGSAMIGGIALLAPKLRSVPVREELGLNAPRPSMLALAALGVIPVGVLSDELTFLIGRLSPSLFDTGVLDAFSQAFSSATTPWFLVLTASIAIFPALGEELLFRGLILRGLAARIPKPAAVLATATLFGALHFDALQGLGAMIIGMYLGLVAVLAKSLWPAVAAHALNNLLCAVFARLDPQGAGSAFDQGHPWYVIVASIGALALVVAVMARSRRSIIDGAG